MHCTGTLLLGLFSGRWCLHGTLFAALGGLWGAGLLAVRHLGGVAQWHSILLHSGSLPPRTFVGSSPTPLAWPKRDTSPVWGGWQPPHGATYQVGDGFRGS